MEINNTFQNRSPFSLDQEYTKKTGNSCVAYSSVAEVNATIQPAYRSVGRYFLVNTSNGNRMYWYQGGTQDSDLVPMDLVISAGTNITLARTGNVISISASSTSVGDSSTMETFTATGNFTKSFPQGTILNGFLFDPPGTDPITVSVGTTPGGVDKIDTYVISAVKPPPLSLFEYFKNTETWYFTGIPSGTLVAIFYRPQIVLV